MRSNPALYGGIGAAGLGAAGLGAYGLSRSDMALPGMGGRLHPRDLKKSRVFKKIAKAAGLGAAGLAGGAAGFAGGRATAERADMEALAAAKAKEEQANKGQGTEGENQEAKEQANARRRANMTVLEERDGLLQKAKVLSPNSDFSGMNSRQILEELYKDIQDVKNIPTDRLRGRLDMEMERRGEVRQYVSEKDGGQDQSLPMSSDNGTSIGLLLRQLDRHNVS